MLNVMINSKSIAAGEENKVIEAMLNPKSIAVIGASDNPSRLGGRPIKFLLENKYAGKIFPVNPKYSEVMGLKCYPSIKEIPEQVDLAVIAIPAKAVSQALQECMDNNVRSAVVFSSGFAETGAEGKDRQEKLERLVKQSSLALCGPNSVGVVNFHDGVGATFSQVLDRKEVVKGPVGFISQSGAFGTFITCLAQERGIGLKYFVSSGNEVDLEFADFLSYMADDPDVTTIAGYLEGIRDGEKIIEAAQKARVNGKPVIVVKVGKTQSGQKAASSHTGSITGSDKVYESFFQQSGIIRAENEEELLDLISLSINGKYPKNHRVAIVTSSGGAGIMLCDKCEEVGLKLAQLSDETKEKLYQVIPDFGSVNNPVDVTGMFLSDPDSMRQSIEIVLEDDEVDIVIFFLGMGLYAKDKIAADLLSIKTDKLLTSAWVAGPQDALKTLRDNKFPVFESVTRCVNAVAKWTKYSMSITKQGMASAIPYNSEKIAHINKDEIKDFLDQKLTQGCLTLTETEAKEILAYYGIPVTKEFLATSQEDAVALANEIGYPLVMKVDSPQIKHKTEAKALRVGIKDEQELIAAYNEIIANSLKYDPSAEIRGVLVQELVPRGTEVIVGTNSDPTFGQTIVFGLGGIFVEILKDITLKVLPISNNEALEMVTSIKGYPLLDGARGMAKRDIAAIIDVLMKVSMFVEDFKDYIKEMDINPLVVFEEGKGVKVVDALIILKDRKQ